MRSRHCIGVEKYKISVDKIGLDSQNAAPVLEGWPSG